MRRIHLRNKGGLTLHASGVHIRRDIGDESADVDIATTDGIQLSKQTRIKNHSPRPTRTRRPPPTRPPATKAKAKEVSEHHKCPPMLPPATKPKSETHKQEWSITEQHLLEQLLAEIPD
ncbi:hypothetical protein EI94DRAFT_1804085 [Lactarius quietus]|nr:hypothetical protein EI94DRAFT_1804085 [Lactarius quietus]